ncbi:MAG: R3H domain-containing nucleic acid-binding protein [Limnothrix sp.]
MTVIQQSSPIPAHRRLVTDDLEKLLTILPDAIRDRLATHPRKDELIEVVMDLGRIPEARFVEGTEDLGDAIITKEDLIYSVERVGMFSGDNRAGIEKTLHRISAMRNRQGEIVGLTCRIGRAVFGTILMIQELVESGKSILLLGRPGVGKTTALREIARVLADDVGKRVVVIDTSNEIAGDGDVPHSAIGRARRMQVATPEQQHRVMIEAVENHMPQVIIIDEIGTELEAIAARTIAERGVQLVGTAHGNRIENLIKNPTLSDLVGGIQAVTLGDEEARKRRSQKTVLERKAAPTFDVAVEMLERQKWVVHEDVSIIIDTLLRGHQPLLEIRTVDDEGNVQVTEEMEHPIEMPEWNPQTSTPPDSPRPRGLRASGKMAPLPFGSQKKKYQKRADNSLDQMIDQSWSVTQGEKIREPGPNGEDYPVYVYPYGVGRSQLEQVIEILRLPIVLTKDLVSADAVLALRSQLKHHSKLRHIAQDQHVPIHAVKSNTIPQITRGLRRLLNMDDPNVKEATDVRLFSQSNTDDEIDALEEARLAVEQIVIPQGQPVELLPRSAKIRKMQHELIEHYRLQSSSFGEDPNRRLRIFPA